MSEEKPSFEARPNGDVWRVVEIANEATVLFSIHGADEAKAAAKYLDYKQSRIDSMQAALNAYEGKVVIDIETAECAELALKLSCQTLSGVEEKKQLKALSTAIRKQGVTGV